jgi:hypothetical protein
MGSIGTHSCEGGFLSIAYSDCSLRVKAMDTPVELIDPARVVHESISPHWGRNIVALLIVSAFLALIGIAPWMYRTKKRKRM